jgi:hypothetical protein
MVLLLLILNSAFAADPFSTSQFTFPPVRANTDFRLIAEFKDSNETASALSFKESYNLQNFLRGPFVGCKDAAVSAANCDSSKTCTFDVQSKSCKLILSGGPCENGEIRGLPDNFNLKDRRICVQKPATKSDSGTASSEGKH